MDTILATSSTKVPRKAGFEHGKEPSESNADMSDKEQTKPELLICGYHGCNAERPKDEMHYEKVFHHYKQRHLDKIKPYCNKDCAIHHQCSLEG